MTPSAFLEAMERACAEAQANAPYPLGEFVFLSNMLRSIGLRPDTASWPAIAERLAELAAEARRNEDMAREVSDG